MVKHLTQWDLALGKELSELDLSVTSAADSERSRLYLEHRLRQELAVPALQQSKDPVLRKLTAELQRIPSFNPDMTAHVNLQMGPVQPQACQGCEADEPRCNRQSCERELALVAPAVISAAGLNEDGTFEGHPIATNEGVTTTPSSGFVLYLQAVEAAGITRETMRPVLGRIARDLVRRSVSLERAQPPVSEPDVLLEDAVARAGFERWRATYAEKLTVLPPLPLKQPADLALFEAYLASEGALYQRFGWRKITRLHSERTRFYRKYVADIRAIRAGKDLTWESAEPPFDDEACLGGPPVASRLCAEVEAASALFIEFLETLLELDSNPQGAEKASFELALALERLTLSGLSNAQVSQFYRDWRDRAA